MMFLIPKPPGLSLKLRAPALTTTVVALIALSGASVMEAADPFLTFVEIQQDGVGGIDECTPTRVWVR